MNNTVKNLIASASALLLTVAYCTASAAPSQAEVNQARGECASHKQRVHKLAENDPALNQARLDWEHACAQANKLINERAGKLSPAPAPTPADAPASAPAPEPTS
jgi:hypothetical protein